MLRTMKTTFKTSKETTDYLYQASRLCADVYNECLDVSKEYSLRNGGKWINQTKLQQAIKGKYPLHSQTVQAVAHKYLFARDAAYKARLKGYRNKYPYRKKKYFSVKWAQTGLVISGTTLHLSRGNLAGKRQTPITLRLKELPPGTIKEVEVIYDRGLKVCLSYEDGVVAPEQKTTGVVAASDHGEINTFSLFAENGNSLTIDGRMARSFHRFRNKKLGELQKLMKRCKKGSRQWKRYNKAKQALLSKSDAKLNDQLHKSTQEVVRWCLRNDVKTLAVGDLDGVQRNTKGKMKKKTTQKLSNWSFGKANQHLTYKLKPHGIRLVKTSEAYTTQTCPVCGNRKKSPGRTYKCRCGCKELRDVHSARNILTKYLTGTMTLLFDIKHKTHQRAS